MREPNPITKAAMQSGEPTFREVGVGPWDQTHPNVPRPDDLGDPANYDPRFDTTLLDEGDRRNVLDKYRYWKVSAIKADLDAAQRHPFEVAIENWTHDFNIGSMVRTANAFAAAKVHIVGPHKWNRKGALMTELYQHIEYHPSIAELVHDWRRELGADITRMQAEQIQIMTELHRFFDVTATARGLMAHRRLLLESRYAELQEAIADAREAKIIAMDIIPSAVPIETYRFPKRCLLLFGAEGPGLSEKALELADDVVFISQFGSVRSINAGAAAAVSMHAWIAQHAA
ncbi:RNA methyltransferase [Bifidobacterium simiarum]|uniref:RNA methyltransferase n=2 Tax=Bifidobacterium simiarum TaxID=2045441 RepID=A0A2M9HF60_9BIFI|nr:TrmH family RNA methyltransferase [Bifidobacterium simiarum]PJM75436.1 RNA methyltransferase [Bifidobacterium simiarum]